MSQSGGASQVPGSRPRDFRLILCLARLTLPHAPYDQRRRPPYAVRDTFDRHPILRTTTRHLIVMPPRALRSQKKQSRLQFSPLPSSSPSKEKYSDAIQDRLAIVRHDDAGRSPSAKSRLQIENGPGGLPTPEKSSQRRLSEHGGARLANLTVKSTNRTGQNNPFPLL